MKPFFYKYLAAPLTPPSFPVLKTLSIFVLDLEALRRGSGWCWHSEDMDRAPFPAPDAMLTPAH